MGRTVSLSVHVIGVCFISIEVLFFVAFYIFRSSDLHRRVSVHSINGNEMAITFCMGYLKTGSGTSELSDKVRAKFATGILVPKEVFHSGALFSDCKLHQRAVQLGIPLSCTVPFP
jgi:hypothetical protein